MHDLSNAVSLEDVRAAADRIRPYVHLTPIATSNTLDELASPRTVQVKLVMKCENLQKVGAFKIRGATNAVLELLAAQPARARAADLTVITHSSGNHAQALAHAARALGTACHVVVPANAARVKAAAVRAYGAAVTRCAPTLRAREDGVRAVAAAERAAGRAVALVPPYDDARIVAGQGTVALELLAQARAGQGTVALELLAQARAAGRALDVLVAPVGGGGLLAGCALAAKGVDAAVRVVGAEPAAADDAARSFRARRLVPSVDPQTVADGLRTSLGAITFPLILEHVDAIHTVSEAQIVRAMKLVYERMKLVIEPSAAVSLAVALYSRDFQDDLEKLAAERGKSSLNVGVVFSGGNVDLKTLSALFETVSDDEEHVPS